MSLSDRFAKLHNHAGAGGNNRRQATSFVQKAKRGANVNQRRGLQNTNDNKKKPFVKGKKTIAKFNTNKVKGGKPGKPGKPNIRGKKGGM